MNLQQSKKHLKCRPVILVLTIIGLVFSVIGSVTLFSFIEYTGYTDGGVAKFIFKAPDITQIIFVLLYFSPFILFLLYVSPKYSKMKPQILITIVLGLLACWHLFAVMRAPYYFLVKRPLFHIPSIIALTLAAIYAARGFPNKILFSISLVTELASNLLYFRDSFSWAYMYSNYIYVGFAKYYKIFTIIFYLGMMSFCTALLTYGLTNGKTRISARKTSPEYQLKLLQEQRNLGNISEEEYQHCRSEIIAKL